MSNAYFDALIHAPNRLKICALLAPIASLEFITLCEQLGVSDSVLSKHIKSLEDADYVVINKKPVREDSELGYRYRPRDVRLLTDM